MDLKKLELFKIELNSKNSSHENLEPFHFFSSGTKFWYFPQRQVPQQAMTQQPTHKQRWIKEFANLSHTVVVKEVADAMTIAVMLSYNFGFANNY